MHKELAKITGTFLGREDHGILTAIIYVDYESGGSQGLGTYALDEYNFDKKIRIGNAKGMEFISNILDVCGVNTWEKLPGRTIYVLKESDKWNSRVLGIAQVAFPSSGKEFLFDDFWDKDANI